MDYLSHFHREVRAFEAAVRGAVGADGAPLVPSCPGWSVTDLVAHLGGVHRYVGHIVRGRLQEPPDPADRSFLHLPAERPGRPVSFDNSPHRGPVPGGLVGWFADGAAALESLLAGAEPGEPVWTWAPQRDVAFWRRIQAVEAAVHRWDAEDALGTAQPVDAEFAADAVSHTFEVMAPARRAWRQAPPGKGERFRFRRTDGRETWVVRFEGDDVRLGEEGVDDGDADVELAGTASDLMLFLWQRLPADRLDAVRGERAMAERYFALVPPV
ncbi:maleylpyruvate isomerase family mycothiol-dependent enzyme [Streptomyces sp. NPDC049577]|uniref:maleylpyruvate isomerase family mycothiol-dependent enzyme n=1 Tax=Streptomyces sp. NPDC049577 TaxID=3155153 RepID=UPI00344A5FB1